MRTVDDGAPAICILRGIIMLPADPISRNDVVYQGRAVFTEYLEKWRLWLP